MRTEKDIFEELELIASEPSFMEVLAFICWEDLFLHLGDRPLSVEFFSSSYDKEKLSRTEISVLYGLACKNFSGTLKPNEKKLGAISLKVRKLMEELHQSIYPHEEILKLVRGEPYNNDVFRSGCIMREAIFYSGECAFEHQYRDLSISRYRTDKEWLEKNKGFNVDEAVAVIAAIEKIKLYKVSQLYEGKDFLSAFKFSIEEVAFESSLDFDTTSSVIKSFSSLPRDGMEIFNNIDDFNYKNAFPITKLNEYEFISFHPYSLWESLYESPFFWFNADDNYSQIASKNRGDYTEDFTAERLSKVFGGLNVFKNVDIYEGKRKRAEIDILVSFGNFTIVVQAKSKKLTINARKGNEKSLNKDFKEAIQNAYNQALLCCELLQKEGVKLKSANGVAVDIDTSTSTFFPICVLSEHYPALAAQAREFLDYNNTDRINHPFVTDIFLIDTISEMLDSPLFFIDYLIKRCTYGTKLISNHELNSLSLHLISNLHHDNQRSLLLLEDNITADLELAMKVRRDNLKGLSDTPKGILTIHKGKYTGVILSQTKSSRNEALQRVGMLILSLSESAINDLNEGIKLLIEKFSLDLSNHDISLQLSQLKTGLTIHYNNDDVKLSKERLIAHCGRRKYLCKSESWHGICLEANSLRIAFAVYVDGKWERCEEMENIIYSSPLKGYAMRLGPKVKRNDPCICGSGKKYKRCCDAR